MKIKCELRIEELFEGRSSQLYTQLLQLQREPEKNSRLFVVVVENLPISFFLLFFGKVSNISYIFFTCVFVFE